MLFRKPLHSPLLVIVVSRLLAAVFFLLWLVPRDGDTAADVNFRSTATTLMRDASQIGICVTHLTRAAAHLQNGQQT